MNEDLRALHARPVFLIGMMGCGKTTIGAELAQLLSCPYLDNDALLLEREGKDLLALAAEGSDVLHDAEARLARWLCTLDPPFVAGIPASIADRHIELNRLRDRGFLVYLRASPKTLTERIMRSGRRPWVGGDPLAWTTSILSSRAPAFEESAQLIVDTDSMTPALLARRIATWSGAST